MSALNHIPEFKFSLRAARISCGYSVEEAAQYYGISTLEMEQYEKDCGDMPVFVVRKMARLYGVSLDSLFIGLEAECIKHNREVAALREARWKEAV